MRFPDLLVEVNRIRDHLLMVQQDLAQLRRELQSVQTSLASVAPQGIRDVIRPLPDQPTLPGME